jgi:hypothetical protein
MASSASSSSSANAGIGAKNNKRRIIGMIFVFI